MTTDKVKERLSYYRTFITIILASIAAITGWVFANYEIVSTSKILMAISTDCILIYIAFLFDRKILQLINSLDL